MSDDVTLADWLLEQVAADEAAAKLTPADWVAPYDEPLHWYPTVTGDPDMLVVHPARVLAECESKRRIVEEAQRVARPDPLRKGDYWRGVRDTAVGFLRILALPYADRPGYRAEWRP